MKSENTLFEGKVLGHPAALFVLFFTEMWERFSYYGMRALLVMFLTASLLEHGWGLEKGQASALFGSYTALVYLSTLLGGYFADNILGYRKAVVVGAILMTFGHAAMAFETTFSIYSGLVLLVFGSGFFKPNMTSMIAHMYKDRPEKKDGAYTIFYMGVNAGAFLGILLCGYLGEKVGWSIGFGLAGIFMLFGMLQFWLTQHIFGDIGLKPKKKDQAQIDASRTNESGEIDSIRFPKWQLGMIAAMSLLGLVWIINDPLSKIYHINVLNFNLFGVRGDIFTILFALGLFVFLTLFRLVQYGKVTRNKLFAVIFFAFLTMFFWAVFEQSPNTLTTFARDYTDRALTGNAAVIFKIINSMMTIIPLAIITWVLTKLFRETYQRYKLASMILSLSFIIIWVVSIWMLREEFNEEATEVTATWFGVLNSLFIISLAPIFSKWWESKYNPPANVKYAIGLTFLAIGMGCVAFGSSGIEAGAKTASVSMIWLVLVYFFHTLGELCISPVGLSYVSKLVPGKMIAFMFGLWYLAIAIGNKVAGIFGESSEKIAEVNGISYFFWALTIIPLLLALLALAVSPMIKRLMQGVK